MPYKNREDRLDAQRRHYASHREEVIAKVKARKYGAYSGVCKNCGGVTMGESKGKASDYCHKGACRSAQWREKHQERMDDVVGRLREEGRL